MEGQKVHIRATMLIPRWGCVTASGEEADSNNPAHEHHIIGVTEGRIESGAWGDATTSGTIFDVTWTWTPGAAIYLNSVALSETPPGVGFVQQVGWALTTQTILVNIR